MTGDGWRLERIVRHRIVVHGAAVVWLAAVALVMLAPALSHGASIGPTDLLSAFGLTATPGVVIHNGLSGDQIQSFIPWTILSWTQVHHGLLPMWNPYSLLGMPLAFNWQSAPFSLPSLIGYLFPMNMAYTAAIVTRLVIAGTGGYLVGRVMGRSWLGAVLTGTVFELSGSVAGWTGWPMVNVLAWAGYALAATILVIRGGHRTRDTVFLAFAMAFAVYGGHPESIGILLPFLVVFAATLLVARAVRSGATELLAGINVVVGLLAGMALAAPLLLPGLQIAKGSTRNAVGGFAVLPAKTAIGFVFSGFWGSPVAGSQWFGPYNYYETAAYVGVIALVLAGVALVSRWRDPEVLAIAVVGIFIVAAVFLAPLRSLLNAVPNGTVIDWNRSLILTGLPIAVLAGLGLDTLIAGFWRRRTVLVAFVGFAAAGLFVALIGARFGFQLSGQEGTIRRASFVWPVATTAVGLLVVLVLWIRLPSAHGAGRPHRLGRGWIAGLVLVVTETAFLVAAGAPLWSASPAMLPDSPGVVALQRAVGSATVGVADCPAVTGYAPVGILPDANDGYSVNEFAIIDPALPAGYYRSWSAETGTAIPAQGTDTFCPSLTTAALARLYGVGFVLQSAGGPPVAGAVFDRRIDGEDLYRVPGAARATLVPRATAGIDTVGTPVAVTHPDPATWRMATAADATSELRLRLTDTPGWHATVDGRPVAVHEWGGIMLEARVPSGRHVVVLRYEPKQFTEGIVIAAVTLIVMIAALVVAAVRGRRRMSTSPKDVVAIRPVPEVPAAPSGGH